MVTLFRAGKPMDWFRPFHAAFMPPSPKLVRRVPAVTTVLNRQFVSAQCGYAHPAVPARFSMSSAMPSKTALLVSLAVAMTILNPMEGRALGVNNGLLENCQPGRASCVSSQDDTPISFLEPWEYEGDLEAVQKRLTSVAMNEPGARLVVKQPRYLRFEIPTANPSITDDLEFFFPAQDNVVHFRSARSDRSFDFLLNRRRLNRLRIKVGLAQIAVLRNRMPALNIFETPFDTFGPSAVDVDAIIENQGLGSRPVR